MDALNVILGAGLIILLLFLVVIVALYVLSALGTSYVLKAFGHKNPWMAWIPLLNYIAMAQIIADENGDVKIFNAKLQGTLYQFWWVILLVAYWFVPGTLGNLVGIAISVVFLGTNLKAIYAKMEGKPEEDVAVIGYLSGWIGLIYMVKFLSYKKNGVVPAAPVNQAVEQVESENPQASAPEGEQ